MFSAFYLGKRAISKLCKRTKLGMLTIACCNRSKLWFKQLALSYHYNAIACHPLEVLNIKEE